MPQYIAKCKVWNLNNGAEQSYPLDNFEAKRGKTVEAFHIQVINLDRSVDRMARISKQLAAEGLNFHRLKATDGRTLSKVDLAHYSALRCLLYYGRRLSSGEIGCFRSHQRAAEAFLQSSREFGLVLEDDAEIPENFGKALDELAEQLRLHADDSWEAVNLGNAPKHDSHLQAIGRGFFGVSLVRAYVFPKRTTALLWSRRGAERFLKETRYIRAPVDQHLHSALSERGAGLASRPALIPHADLPSDINAEVDAASVRQVDKPSPWYRFRRAARKRSARRNRSKDKA
ncbi:glycosyltransferase family 25 protein [Alloyangia pacifica]|uniref:glycosyltransferase family 25 protein n=1 Tax=Alloyangia pacifica TaxID=311180 RepID=UPI001CD1FFEA|nr:glycosyltransferase family 25 protein [Alloyangia pacifica]